MKKAITLSIFFLVVYSLESNPITSGNLILWGEREITWDDFNGRPDYTVQYAAITSTMTVLRNIKSYRDSVEVAVETFFLKEKSWIKQEMLSEQLLRHERTHFNIGELYSRKVRKLYSSSIYPLSKFQNTIIEQKSKLNAEKKKLNEQYDSETNYSKNDSVQKIWDKRIKHELDELHEFSSIYVILRTDSKK